MLSLIWCRPTIMMTTTTYSICTCILAVIRSKVVSVLKLAHHHILIASRKTAAARPFCCIGTIRGPVHRFVGVIAPPARWILLSMNDEPCFVGLMHDCHACNMISLP